MEKQLKLSALSSITDKEQLEEDKRKRIMHADEILMIEKEVRENSLKSLNEYLTL